MITKTKICGITTTEDYIVCRDAGAAFVGMVHYPGSSRHLSLGTLSKLAACSAATDPHAPDRVLLSVDVPVEDLSALIEAGNPDLLQLHGNETPEYVATIKTRFGLPKKGPCWNVLPQKRMYFLQSSSQHLHGFQKAQ